MSLTCLIAAHDPWFLQLLRMFVEESGFRAVQVYEGQEVLPMIRQENPAAVFIQIDLPGKVETLEILRALRADPSTSQVPVMVCSWQGHSGGEEVQAELLRGAAAYLQEPITFEIFQDALRKAGIQSLASHESPYTTPEKKKSSKPKITHDQLN